MSSVVLLKSVSVFIIHQDLHKLSGYQQRKGRQGVCLIADS